MLKKLHKIKREKKTTCINTKKKKRGRQQERNNRPKNYNTKRKTSTKWQYKSFLFNSTLNVY